MGGCAPVGSDGTAGAPAAGGDAATQAAGGAPVWDKAKVGGSRLLLEARVGEGPDGVECDSVGLQSQAGLAYRRPPPADGRSRRSLASRVVKAGRQERYGRHSTARRQEANRHRSLAAGFDTVWRLVRL